MHTPITKLLALLLCGIAVSAQATPITGQLNVQSGSVVLTPNQLGAVTNVAGSMNGKVTSVEGSYPSSLVGGTVTYKPFNTTVGSQAIAGLWSVLDTATGFTYSFDLNSVLSVIQTGSNLLVNGEGKLWSTNPDLTAAYGLWSYGINSADGSPTNGVFSFQSNNVATAAVPDGASTLILLGVGLMGVAGLSRVFQKNSFAV
ncbi:MAG: hypothetical protein QM715_13950 [Nibricoccus sp.]